MADDSATNRRSPGRWEQGEKQTGFKPVKPAFLVLYAARAACSNNFASSVFYIAVCKEEKLFFEAEGEIHKEWETVRDEMRMIGRSMLVI